MKRKSLIVLIAIFSIQFINAQNNEKEGNTYYLSSEINLGNYYGLDFNFNYIFKNKYSLKLGFSGNIREPKTQPIDYSAGLNGLFSLGTENPYDYFLNYKVDLEEFICSTIKEQ
jgi:hypothetical protein